MPENQNDPKKQGQKQPQKQPQKQGQQGGQQKPMRNDEQIGGDQKGGDKDLDQEEIGPDDVEDEGEPTGRQPRVPE